MSLLHILIVSGLFLLIGWLFPVRYHKWIIAIISLVGIYWLQPSTPIRYLDFWLPTVSIFLVIVVWITIKPDSLIFSKRDWISGILIILFIIIISLSRYINLLCCLTPSRPPHINQVAIIVFLFLGCCVLTFLFTKKKRIAWIIIFLLVSLFIIQKSPQLSYLASTVLRQFSGQNISLANSLDIRWLGYSYLAFRLFHVLRDFSNKRLPSYNFLDFFNYVLFIPSLTAGPIARSQDFFRNLEKNELIQNKVLSLSSPNLFYGLRRITWGLFKKFVIADSLAIISLNPLSFDQIISTTWLWIVIYAYSLRIYFDFSGYTDIALGIANLVGITLPENFTSPYLKTNITSFWNSWHITLADWFRAYFYNPLTRYMRNMPNLNLPVWLIILTGQISTMVLIGLWHGITINFAIWGLWHAIGLFIHNRWLDFSRVFFSRIETYSNVSHALKIISWIITFNYVTLGWIWFVLPEPTQAIRVFMMLLGF